MADIKINDVVLSQWQKSRNAAKYPAIVKSIISKTTINVEFYDGVVVVTDLSNVTLLDAELQKEVKL